MRVPSPRTLRGRLALWYGCVLALALVTFSVLVYFVDAEENDEAPPAVAGAREEEGGDQRILLALAVGLPAALLVAVAGGWLISRRALRPVDEVVRVTGDLGADQLDRRVPVDPRAGEEIGRMVGSLNAMLDRLQGSVEAMRRFTADASHELRTPIATLMGEIEVTLRRPRSEGELRSTLESSLEELGRLARLVESLLTLARSDSGELPMERVRLDLVELTRRVLDPYGAIAGERGLTLRFEPEGEAWVDGDSLWIGRALANLVDNACKFTPRGGAVTVRVEQVDERVRVHVINDGPSLSDDERERIFQRFYRGIHARGSTDGFGLGLALAREIARACGGELRLEHGAETHFCLELASVLNAVNRSS